MADDGAVLNSGDGGFGWVSYLHLEIIVVD
jgi:hypothetical protein